VPCARFYVLLIGLGGLLLGMLIVLTALPTVPISGELLTTLSVGVPVALALHFAWVNRDWSAGTKAVGFAAARPRHRLGLASSRSLRRHRRQGGAGPRPVTS
jgi:hypothetical protein